MNIEKDLTKEQIRKIFIESSKPYWNFLTFVESLRRDNNNTLIESITAGTLIMLENNDIPKELDRYKALDTEINQIAKEGAKEGGGIEIRDPNKRTKILVYINNYAKNKMNKTISETKMVTPDSTRSPEVINMIYEKGFSLMLEYLTDKAFNEYDPDRLYENKDGEKETRTFTEYIKTMGSHGVAIGFALEAMGKTKRDEWEPGKQYSIHKEETTKDMIDIGQKTNEVNFPIIRYNANKNDPNEIYKTYKRTLPSEQVKPFKKLMREFKQTKTGLKEGPISYYTRYKKDFGPIAIDIPDEYLNVPPNDSPYWEETPDYGVSDVGGMDTIRDTREEGNAGMDEKGKGSPVTGKGRKLYYGETLPTEEERNEEELDEEGNKKSKYGDTSEEFDLEYIMDNIISQKERRGSPITGIERKVMDNIYAGDNDNIYDYLASDVSEQEKIIRKAIADVLYKMNPKLMGTPPATIDPKSNEEYISKAYEWVNEATDGGEIGKDDIPKALYWARHSVINPVNKKINGSDNQPGYMKQILSAMRAERERKERQSKLLEKYRPKRPFNKASV